MATNNGATMNTETRKSKDDGRTGLAQIMSTMVTADVTIVGLAPLLMHRFGACRLL